MLFPVDVKKGWALRLTETQWAVLGYLDARYQICSPKEIASLEHLDPVKDIAQGLSSPERKMRKRDVREALYALVGKGILPSSFLPND